MDDWKQDAIEAAKHLNKQSQHSGARVENQMKDVSNGELGQLSSGLPQQQNKSGYQLGRFQHASENSPRGQVMMTTAPNNVNQSLNNHAENAAFTQWTDKGTSPQDMTQKDHKKEVAPASSTVTQSSQSPTHSGPEPSGKESSDRDQSKKSILDRYSSQKQPSDKERSPDKTPQQDKDHER